MKYILILSLVLIILLSPLFIVLTGNRIIFSFIYDKLNLYQYNTIEKSDYLNKISSIVKYFFDNSSTLNMGGLTEIEKIHMQDVKFLIRIALLLLMSSMILIILLGKHLSKIILRKAALMVILFDTFLLLFSLTNFDEAFVIFHKLLFRNNYWLLDETTLLIRLFPETVFMILAYFIFGISFFVSLLILFISV